MVLAITAQPNWKYTQLNVNKFCGARSVLLWCCEWGHVLTKWPYGGHIYSWVVIEYKKPNSLISNQILLNNNDQQHQCKVCYDCLVILYSVEILFHILLVVVYQANLAVQEARYEAAMKDLNKAQDQLDEKEKELEAVQAQYDQAMSEKQVTATFYWFYRMMYRHNAIYGMTGCPPVCHKPMFYWNGRILGKTQKSMSLLIFLMTAR